MKSARLQPAMAAIAFRIVQLVAVLLAGVGVPRGLEAADPPNIVLIVADDLGWSDLACYGNSFHETPRLDRLASESVKFTAAYAASPVCSPTRASILTGRHPARLNMTIWREAAKTRGNRRLLEPVVRDALPLRETTLAEILKDHGYYTAHVGKWHLGGAAAYPQAHGFDVNVGGTLWGAPQTFFYPFRGDQYYSDWRYVPDLEPSKPGDYLTDRLTDKAIEIIRRVKQRPFYLNLWYHTVHTPIEGKKELVAKYERKLAADPKSSHRNPDYAAMVESLDHNVGRVLDALAESGIERNTIVVFFSDNGGYINNDRLHPGRRVTSNVPLRSGKGSLYEGGIRVPMMVRVPGMTAGGATCGVPVWSCDLLPTLLATVGLGDACRKLELDGIDVSPWLRQPNRPASGRLLFFHYPHYYPTTVPVSAVRQGRWKLIENLEQGNLELYDLDSDIAEERDLAQEHPERVRRLHRRLSEWRTSVGAPMPEPNPMWRKQRRGG